MANTQNQTLSAGTRLGVYEIKETSKIHTFDIVYRAWNHHLKEQIEITEYFPQNFAIRASDGLGVEAKSPEDKENFDYGLKAFLEQSEILTQIDHPNIVKAENTLQFNGTAYLVTAYQEGTPLSRLVRAPAAIAGTELKFILISILNALQKVHENQIAHAGIKSESIILTKNGEPLLTGFADASAVIGSRTPKPTDELASGYAAPEQYELTNKPGPAADFYALGATMYYCITHSQPVSSPNRLMALSKGESDPLPSLSGSAAALYSPALLQTIEWMLQPEYKNRPQTAAEILAQLTLVSTSSNQDEPKASKQGAYEDAISSPANKKSVWISAMIGVAGMAVLAFWLTKKPSEPVANDAQPVNSQPLSQSSPDKILANPTIKEGQTIAQSTPTLANQPSEPDKKPEAAKEEEIAESQKQAQQTEKGPELKTSADDGQYNNGSESAKASFPADKPAPLPGGHTDNVTTLKDSGGSQKTAENIPPSLQVKKPKLPVKPGHEGAIPSYLAAARKAMKELRFTTPAGNNANMYYQMVLDKAPENAEALAGRQKIVDRYAKFIQISKADGELDRARRVLQKAESVLPNDPKLQRIHSELFGAKK